MMLYHVTLTTNKYIMEDHSSNCFVYTDHCAIDYPCLYSPLYGLYIWPIVAYLLALW